MPAREVEEHRTRLHAAQFALADQVVVRRTAVDVQAHRVRLREKLGQRPALARVAERQPFLEVVVDDLHPHRLGKRRQLRADVPVAHDPEHLAAYLRASGGGLPPAAVVQQARGVRHASHQHDELADGQFHHAAGVAVGRVEDRHAVRGGGGEIDLLGADAEAPDRKQPVGGAQDARGDARLGADAQDAHALHGTHQFVLAERIAQHLDPVALVAQQARGVRVHVLAEERRHAALGKRRGARQAVEPEHLVHRASHAVGARHHLFALDVLAVGHELGRRAVVADLGVGDAVADGDDPAGKPESAHHARLAPGLRQRVAAVEARHALALPPQVVAVHLRRRDAEIAAHRLDVLAEAA